MGADDVAEGSVVICYGPEMEEVRRESIGVKWCFKCRSRHEFHWVKTWPIWDKEKDPDGYSQCWGGDYFSECSGCKAHGSDLFPGWYREAVDE